MCTPFFILWLLFAAVTNAANAAIFPISAVSPLCNATDVVTETVFVTASLVTPPVVTVTVTASSVSSALFTPLPTAAPPAPVGNATTTVTETVGISNDSSTTVTLFSTTRLTMTTVIPPFANTTAATVFTNMSVNSTTTVVATEMTTSTLVLANLSSTTTESVDTIMPSLTPASVPDTVVLTFPPLPTITASQDSNSTVTNTFGQTATVTETSIALVTLTTTTDGPGPAPFVPVPATTAMSESSLDQENMTTTTTTMISTRNISLVIITSGTTTVFPTISSGLTTGTGTGSVNSTSSNITTFNASTQTPTFGVLSTSSLSLTPVQTGSAASFRVPYFARAVVLIGRMLVKADDLPIAVSAPDSGLINVTVAGPTPAGAPVPMSIPIISTSTFYDNCTTTSTTDISSISVSVPLPFPAPETFESISSSTTVTDTLTAQTTIETTVVIDNTTATFNVPVIPPQFTTPSPGSLAPPPFFNMTGQLATTTAPDVTTAPSTDSNSSTTTPFNLLTFLTGTGADNDTATDTPPSETGLWLNTSSGLDAHNSYLTSSASTYPPTPTPTAHGGAGVAMPLPPKGLVIGTVTCLLFMGAGAWIVL